MILPIVREILLLFVLLMLLVKQLYVLFGEITVSQK